MNEALWAFGRGSGVLALVFLTIAVALGIGSATGRPLVGLPRFGVAEIHRVAASIGATLVGLHIVSLLPDPYAQLRLVDFVVPFLGNYRPLFLGMGTLAFDLLIAVVVTSTLRRTAGPKVFRTVHWLAYALWPFALGHALGIGSDATTPCLLGTALTCLGLATLALGWRISSDFREYQTLRRGEHR